MVHIPKFIQRLERLAMIAVFSVNLFACESAGGRSAGHHLPWRISQTTVPGAPESELTIFARQDPPHKLQFEYRFVFADGGLQPISKNLLAQISGPPGLICSFFPQTKSRDSFLKFQHADAGGLIVDIVDTKTGEMYSNALEGGDDSTRMEFYRQYNQLIPEREINVGYLDNRLDFHNGKADPLTLFPQAKVEEGFPTGTF